jgi:hypothetical protein
MSEQPLDLTITLHDDVDNDELELLTRQMCEEVGDLDVESVGPAPGGEAPPGSKGDAITIGSIVVALASAGVFTGLIELLKSWALRREGRTVTVKAKVGDRELELAYSPALASQNEMTRFVSTILGALKQEESRVAGG